MTTRWLSPEAAAEIAQRNRETWKALNAHKSAAYVDPRVLPGDPQPKPTPAANRQPRRRSADLPAPSETSECLTFVAWTKLVTYQGAPLYDRVVKIANERGKAGVMTAILTSIGMRDGFPDYDILAPAGRWHGLYLEAKKRRGGRTDDAQVAWRDKLRAWGYHAEICNGADELIAATRWYFTHAGCEADGSWIDRTDRTRGQSR